MRGLVWRGIRTRSGGAHSNWRRKSVRGPENHNVALFQSAECSARDIWKGRMNEEQEKQNRIAPTPTKRRRGRPAKEPSWLKSVAEAVGRGTSLRRALWRERVYGLSESEIRNIYRWVKFRKMMEEARLEYFREYGVAPRKSGSRVTLIERLLAKSSTPTLEDLVQGGKP